MSDVKVYFLDEEYTVPEELQEFVKILHYFEDIHNDLMPLLTAQMKRKGYSGGADADFIYFKTPLSKVGEKIIANLAKKNIFDVTLNELVFNNKGYIQLYNVCSETMQGMVNILMNAMQTWLDGYENAYSSAASTITGSGVSIWTSSLSSALIYSALEASTLKKQTDKADIQYRAAMSSLNANISDNQERQETNLLINKYYPGVAEALSLFVSEIMECYVTKLEQHGIFDYSKIKKYDLKRSSDLLKNITLVPDKVGVLKEAFVCCPYNPDVYNAVMENSLSNLPTFETAKYFMQDGVLTNVIEEYAKNNVSNLKLVAVLVKVLALYKGQSEQSIWKLLYADDYSKLHVYYKNLNNVIDNQYALVAWIKDNITSDAVVLCEMSNDAITNTIKNILNKKVITDEQFSLFQEIGILDNEFNINKSLYSLDEINAEYAYTIIININQFIINLQNHIHKYSETTAIAKQKYEEAQQSYNIKLRVLQSRESELQTQRTSLGIFAFSKKKELDAKILECQNEMSALKTSDITPKLKKEYEQNSRELHSLDI